MGLVGSVWVEMFQFLVGWVGLDRNFSVFLGWVGLGTLQQKYRELERIMLVRLKHG